MLVPRSTSDWCRCILRIHRAAEGGDKEGVLAELAAGIDVNLRDNGSSEMTPLMYAAWSEAADISMLELLLAGGADINVVTKQCGSTALSLSVSSPEKFKYLLAAGAEKFAGKLSLRAFPYGTDFELGQLLLDLGYDPSAYDAEGAEEFEELEELKDVRCPSRLESAARHLELEWLRLFESNKVSFDSIDWTALMREIVLGTIDSIRTQLAVGASLVDVDFLSRTPLLLAVRTGDVEKAKLIVEAGGDLEHRGHAGMSVLDCAIESKSTEMLRWLLELGVSPETPGVCDWRPLYQAAEEGNAGAVELLLAAGADVFAVDNCDIQAINVASNIEVAKLLVAAGADINRIDGTGKSPLRAAVEKRNLALFAGLVELGADVNLQHTFGRTALHEATNYDNLEMMTLLLKNGADPNAAEEDGWRPLWSVRSEAAAELLIASGADVYAQDDFCQNALMFHRNGEFCEFFKDVKWNL